MKFHFGNLFVRLGSAPISTDNFIAIEQVRSNYLIRLAAFAEQFDTALAFYMEVCAEVRNAAECCWFELQRRIRRRFPNEILRGSSLVGRTHKGALYGNIGSEEIRTLINEFWLSDRFRIIGTSRITANVALGLAIALDIGPEATADAPRSDIIFTLEKQYFSGEVFLALLVDNRTLKPTRELISRAATRLQCPLIEMGPGAWPPRE